jgi:hypothetical protein
MFIQLDSTEEPHNLPPHLVWRHGFEATHRPFDLLAH